MKVPFVDLQRTNSKYISVWQRECAQIIELSQLVNGPHVAEFEKRFADFTGVQYCVGVGSGLDALTILLKSTFKEGDLLAIPNMTFAATAEAVIHAGMQPVICDVDEYGFLKDDVPFPVTGAVPVYLFGKMRSFKRKKIVIDACQAHGAFQVRNSAAFSFYPSKNLGCFGDGGAICVNDQEIYEKCKMYREHGQIAKYDHKIVGYTSRLDTIQAIILNLKLKDLKAHNNERIELAGNYYKAFKEIGLRTQCDKDDFYGNHVFHLFVILTEKRKELMAFLDSKEIGYGLHYPKTLIYMPCYKQYKISSGIDSGWHASKPYSYKNSEIYAIQGLTLPIFPGMTKDEQKYVINSIEEFYDKF